MPEETPIPLTNVPSVVYWVLTTLVVVVGVLWKIVLDHFKATKTELEKCEESHKEATTVMLEMKEELGLLKGKVDSYTEVKALATSVLKKLEDP